MQRFLGILVVILVLAGVAGYFTLTYQQRARLARLEEASQDKMEQVETSARSATQQLAEDLARVLATAISGDLSRGEYGGLQSEIDAMVRGNRVVRIIVLDASGKVVATTDRRYVGQGTEDEGNRRASAVQTVTVEPGTLAPGQIEVDAPVALGSQQVGAVRVFVNIAP